MEDKQEEQQYVINMLYLFIMFSRLLEKETFIELIFNRDDLGSTVVEIILELICRSDLNHELQDALFMTALQGDIIHVVSLDNYVQRMLPLIAITNDKYRPYLVQRLGL